VAPSFKHFVVRPQPGNLSSAAITVLTQRGAISLQFSQGAAKVSVALAVPAGSSAKVCLPPASRCPLLLIS